MILAQVTAQVAAEMAKSDPNYVEWLIISALCAVITALAIYIVKLHIGGMSLMKDVLHENTVAMTDQSASNRELTEGIRELRQAIYQK